MNFLGGGQGPDIFSHEVYVHVTGVQMKVIAQINFRIISGSQYYHNCHHEML